MCLAVPGIIKSIHGNLAKVDIMGIEKNVDIELIENPKIKARELMMSDRWLFESRAMISADCPVKYVI